MLDHGKQFDFKGKRENIAKVNILIMAYPNQHIDIDIHGSGRAVEKSAMLLQIEKAAESSNDDLTSHLFSL